VSTLTGNWVRLADWARGLPPMAVDAVIATACWINVVFQGVVDDRLQWWVLALATANSLPLLWRRRHPFAVTIIAGVGTTWLAVTETLGDLAAAQLVATYTFASLSPPVKRLIAVAGTIIGVSVSILVPDESALQLGLVGISFVVAYALGTAARARRDRIAMLEERARRLAEEQDAAAARERERIAREMHDTLAHAMSMVVVQAEAGPVAVRRDPDKAEEMFDTISATAREALTQLRRALGVLRSEGSARRPQPGLDDLPALVDSVRNTGLTVTLEENGRARTVPPDLGGTAYRIVQESLTNTVKHAAASSVQVRLGWHDGSLRLEVYDDGRGPSDPSGSGEGEPGGHGLVGMRERVAAAGGELTVGPGPGGVGFRVAASLPLN
jgi:signal transduction histidine kinase